MWGRPQGFAPTSVCVLVILEDGAAAHGLYLDQGSRLMRIKVDLSPELNAIIVEVGLLLLEWQLLSPPLPSLNASRIPSVSDGRTVVRRRQPSSYLEST